MSFLPCTITPRGIIFLCSPDNPLAIGHVEVRTERGPLVLFFAVKPEESTPEKLDETDRNITRRLVSMLVESYVFAAFGGTYQFGDGRTSINEITFF